MEPNLVLTLLLHTASGAAEISQVAEEMPLERSTLEERLRGLAARNLLSLSGDAIVISVEQRFHLALHALRSGLDLEAVCETLDWREFEDFTRFALERNGFTTRKHFRFTTSRRYEVDVLGWKEPYLVAIECKHWKRSWQRAATHRFVEVHRQRVEALAEYATTAKGKLGLDSWRERKLVPIVLTLSETPIKVHNAVPVVPIYYLQDVLSELERLLGWRVEIDVE